MYLTHMRTCWASETIWALTKCLVISVDIFLWGEGGETEQRINPLTSPDWAKLVLRNQYYDDKPHKAFIARPGLPVRQIHKCNQEKEKRSETVIVLQSLICFYIYLDVQVVRNFHRNLKYTELQKVKPEKPCMLSSHGIKTMLISCIPSPRGSSCRDNVWPWDLRWDKTTLSSPGTGAVWFEEGSWGFGGGRGPFLSSCTGLPCRHRQIVMTK